MTIAAFTLGCATSNNGIAGNGLFPIDGQWELPEGQFMLFKGHAFGLWNRNGKKIINGVFSQTDTQITLITVTGKIPLNYSVSLGKLKIITEQNEWMNGVWRKHNGVLKLTGNDPLIGYWESREDGKITILHILPTGHGYWYNYDLANNKMIQSYLDASANTPFEFSTTLAVDVDGKELELNIPFTYKYNFEPSGLLIVTHSDKSGKEMVFEKK
jgi:hypothetical protein